MRQQGEGMRKITIAGKDYDVRGLKRSEIRGQLKQYGFKTMMWIIPEKEENGKKVPDLDLIEDGQALALELVLGPDKVAEIDEAGGNAALKEAFIALSKETYGDKDEEKNSSTPGGASPTGKE